MTKTLKKAKYDEELLEQVHQLMVSGSVDQKTLAQRTGYSGAVISLYLKGSYDGAVEKLESALKKYLTAHSQAREYKKLALKFVKTSVAERIYTVAKLCRLNSEINVCYGSSGVGKTTALRNYTDEQSGVILIDPDECASMRSVLFQLADKLKLSLTSTKTENLLNEITKKLYNSGFLVIVDEAENLKIPVFKILRKIHDRCEFSFGLLFVGTEKLYHNLKRLRGEFVYLTNRISYVEKLDILTEEDIQALTNQVFPDCDDVLLKQFERQSNGNARILFNTLKRTKDIKASSGDDLNLMMIASARSSLLV